MNYPNPVERNGWRVGVFATFEQFANIQSTFAATAFPFRHPQRRLAIPEELSKMIRKQKHATILVSNITSLINLFHEVDSWRSH